MSEPAKPKDNWDKFQILGTVASLVAVPIVIGVVGNMVSISLKERDVRLKTVELAISILNENPKSAPETPELRRWAMTVIDRYSGVDLPDPAKQELEKSPLPLTYSFGGSADAIAKFTELFSPKVYKCPTTKFEFHGYSSEVVAIQETSDGCVMRLFAGQLESGPPVKCPTVKGTLYAPVGWKIAVKEENGKCEMGYAAVMTSPKDKYWPGTLPK